MNNLNKGIKARVIATSKALPEKVLTNADLEKIVDTTDEWIVTRTGMKERRIVGDNEFTSTLGARAAKTALEKASLKPEAVDLILVATLTPDYVFPSTACLIQEEIRAVNAAAMDVQAACSGYIYTLSIAKAYIESGLYSNVLVVASESLSRITDYSDRSTCVLFGDGATAALVSNEGPGLVIQEFVLGSDGSQSEILYMPAGGSRNPASEQTVKCKEHYIKMNGREVFKHAVRRMESAAELCLDRMNLTGEDIKCMIPHQANMRIIESLAKRFGISMDRVVVTLQKYANTSASTCGIALDEFLENESLSEDDHILLVAFGSGLTWASMILTRIEG